MREKEGELFMELLSLLPLLLYRYSIYSYLPPTAEFSKQEVVATIPDTKNPNPSCPVGCGHLYPDILKKKGIS